MSQNDRLHALDAVRAFALLAGIVLHATMSFFLPAPVLDNSQSVTLGLAFYVIHIFRMSAFYLIAGFFARMALERRGLDAFISDRSRRILLPMLGGWLAFAPVTTVVAVAGAILMFDGQPPPPPEQNFPLLHLWFLYYLTAFYVLALALRWLFAVVIDRSGNLRRLVDGVIRVALRGYFAPLLFAAPLALVLNFDVDWPVWFGIPTPDQGFSLKLPAMVGFGTAFGVGWLVHRQIGLIDEWRRRWIMNLAAAVALTVAALAMVGLSPPNLLDPEAALTAIVVPGPEWRRPVYALCYTLAVWYWTFGLIGAAMRFCSEANARIRYLADASYWLYLAHLPLVFLLQVAAARLPWHWSIKFPLITGLTIALLLVSYRYWVRHTWLGDLLNGRRVPRPVPGTAVGVGT